MRQNHKDQRIISPWVGRWAPLVPESATVLDVACGGGRHIRHFLETGHTVTGVDVNPLGTADLIGAEGFTFIQADLENAPWPLTETFDLVICTSYLWRPILAKIFQAVAPGGYLIYETFANGNETYGRPSNPDFLLEPGELLRATPDDFTIIAYEDVVDDAPKPGCRQRICVRRNT